MTGTSHPDNDELRAAVAALVDMFGGHAGHTLSQVGPCVYCDDCDIRLYQGTLPDKKRVPAPAKERHDRWFKHAMDLAAEVSRLRAEVDTLRADQALDQEGHQRVCVPIEAERDTLRDAARDVPILVDEMARVFDRIEGVDVNDLEVRFDDLRTVADRLRPLVFPDPAEVAALAAHNPQDGTDGD